MARAARQRKRKGEIVLAPVRPNLGIEVEYRKKLYALIDAMARSAEYWIAAAYRKNEPVLAQDETPAETLRKQVDKLKRQWFKRFDEASDDLAKWFAQSAAQRSSASLKSILKRGGFTVELKLTSAVRDVVQASVAENVALIKSIPQNYFTQIEGSVMRSVTAGRDLAQLTDELQQHYGVTRRRAALIARDQNNKATAAVTRARQQDAGIKEAIWVHSGGGKHPRKSHLKAGRDRVRYQVAEGWFDPEVQKRIWPGELINCRCVARAVVKGFS